MQNPQSIISDLQNTLQRLAREADQPSQSTKARQALEADIRKTIDSLTQLLAELDPVRQPTAIFDPSNPKIVGRFISLALVAQPTRPLTETEVDRFYGSGVYALYYTGDLPLYAPISRSETPIYVGQAAPAIKNASTPAQQGEKLSKRLEEHRKNIAKAVGSIEVSEFQFRALTVASGWETAAEDYLIHLFRPIWNSETKILYGLGKHGDSAETRSNKRSPWDTIHPGRKWAANPQLQDAKNLEQIINELNVHFKRYPVFHSLDDVLNSFIDELRQI